MSNNNQKYSGGPSASDIVDEMEKRGLVSPQKQEVGTMTKLGFALGGAGATVCYTADAIPVIGHVKRGLQDMGEGMALGYQVRMGQLAAKEQAAREQAEASVAQMNAALA